MNYYSLQEKATDKYVVRIKRLTHGQNTYLYRTSKTPMHICEDDINKIENIGDFIVKPYNYKFANQGNKVKNKFNKSLKSVVLQKRKRLTIKRNLLGIIMSKRVNLFVLSECNNVADYNSYVQHDIKDCLNEQEFKQIKKAGENYGWKK